MRSDAALELHDLAHAFGQQLLVAEHAAVRLHRLADRVRDLRHRFAGGRAVEARQPRARQVAGVARQRRVRAAPGSSARRCGCRPRGRTPAGRAANWCRGGSRRAPTRTRIRRPRTSPWIDRVRIAVWPGRHRPGRGCWSARRPSGSGWSGTTGIGSLIGSTLANLSAISRIDGSRFMITSGPRWSSFSSTWSFSGPAPRPSLISWSIERDTTSRDARSFRFGA